LEAAMQLDKLRRTTIPIFSGGMDLLTIRNLNRKIETELYTALRSSSPQRVSIELSTKTIE
jgi:hypothetical protein